MLLIGRPVIANVMHGEHFVLVVGTDAVNGGCAGGCAGVCGCAGGVWVGARVCVGARVGVGARVSVWVRGGELAVDTALTGVGCRYSSGRGCAVVISFQCFEFVSAVDTVLHVNDPGFYSTRYAMGDVVGWRLFAMNDTRGGL